MLVDMNGNVVQYTKSINIIDCNLISHKQAIEDWLDASIWAYSKKKQEFQIRDIVAEENFDWSENPLQFIYNYYISNGCSHADAVKKAGKEVGKISKRVICNSKKHNYQQLQGRGYFNSNVYKRL